MNTDLKRFLIDLNIETGRKYQSAQTGFIHYCYETPYEMTRDTIPLLENACFALALFRSRQSEHVLEGKALLEKLLAFHIDGQFPIYLHEYPLCKDRCLAINLIPALFWIYNDFQAVLGEELKAKLLSVLSQIVIAGKKIHAERPLPKGIEMKLRAFKKDVDFSSFKPTSAQEWADFLIAYQMVGKDNLAPLSDLMQDWDPTLLAYVGPQRFQKQYQEEPLLSLYDLFMGQLGGAYPKRVKKTHPIHLQAALVQPFVSSLPPSVNQEELSYAFCKQEEPQDPFTLLWKEGDHLHSLICACKKGTLDVKKAESSAELTFDFSEELPKEGQEQIEFSLFCNLHNENTDSQNQILIEGKKATTFQLFDCVEILSNKMKIELRFVCQGVVFGHLLRANRPSQEKVKAAPLFAVYDWQIALRTIKREPKCQLKVFLTLTSHP